MNNCHDSLCIHFFSIFLSFCVPLSLKRTHTHYAVLAVREPISSDTPTLQPFLPAFVFPRPRPHIFYFSPAVLLSPCLWSTALRFSSKPPPPTVFAQMTVLLFSRWGRLDDFCLFCPLNLLWLVIRQYISRRRDSEEADLSGYKVHNQARSKAGLLWPHWINHRRQH